MIKLVLMRKFIVLILVMFSLQILTHPKVVSTILVSNL